MRALDAQKSEPRVCEPHATLQTQFNIPPSPHALSLEYHTSRRSDRDIPPTGLWR
jgi:hypothetical protein